MTNTQRIVLLLAAGLFALMYFGFDIKPESQKLVEKQRALQATATDASALMTQARGQLSADQVSALAAIEHELEAANDDAAKAALYKELSAKWFDYGKPAIAGHYAELIAEIENTEDAWSIAGTTFSICIQKEQEEKVKDYCTAKAIESLEKATSLNPENLQHRVNLALVYTENPPKDNPMKGILMLVDLNKKYPGNAMILTQLGRLAIKTGQYEKAVERLEAAVSAEPNNLNANCLLAQAFSALGNSEAANRFSQKCEQLSSQ